MINIVIILFCLLLATLHYIFIRKTASSTEVIDLYLVYFLFFTVGLVGALGFISHVFYPDQTAKLIGWPTGSPFQFEVGFHDGAWGLLGFLSLKFRDKFWLATGLGWSFFMLGADYGHIKDLIVHQNVSPYNAGSIIPDLVIPIILLFLLYLKFVKN